MGAELGHFLEISPATLNRVNLTEAWLKADMENVSEMSLSLLAKFPVGTCVIEVVVFSCSRVPLRAGLTGFSSLSSSHGRCCRSSTSEISSFPVSKLSGVGSVGGKRSNGSPLSSSSSSEKTSPFNVACESCPHSPELKAASLLPVIAISSLWRIHQSSGKQIQDQDLVGMAFNMLPILDAVTEGGGVITSLVQGLPLMSLDNCIRMRVFCLITHIFLILSQVF